MPLSIPAAPSACLAAFSNGLPAFLPGAPAGTVVSETYVGTAPPIPTAADVSTGAGGPPNVTTMIQIFALSLADAANNTGVISPSPAGWGFFAGGTSTTSVLGRVVQRGSGWKLVAVQYGGLIWQTWITSRQLPTLLPASFQAGDYELRLLTVPGLNLEAFWLAPQTAGFTDLIVSTPTPVKPAVILGDANHPLEMTTFLAEIRPLAASLLNLSGKRGA
ncbi:MAG: hypothetical protein WBE37_20180 [Bryobacteraceae bacterium]